MNADIVTAIATAVLAIITGFYAWFTFKILKEAKNSRELQLLPVLRCEINCDLKTSERVSGGYNPGEFNIVIIQNVGNAAAIKTDLKIDTINPQVSIWNITPVERYIGTIGIEQLPFPLDKAIWTRNQEQPKIRVDLNYSNPFEKKFKTLAVFELETGIVPPGQLWPESNWKKISEDITIEN